MFMRAPRRSERLIQSGLGITDSSEASQARRPNRMGVGLPRSVLQSGQLLGGCTHRGLDFVQPLGVGQHRQLPVETCTPGRQTHGIACSPL